MSIFKQNDYWMVNISHEGERYRRKSPINSRNGALTFEGELRAKIANGESIDKKAMSIQNTFKDFAKEWMEKYVIVHNKHSEQIQKKSILNKHLLPYFGEYKLGQINGKIINDYKAEKLAEGKLAKKSINNHLAILSKLLNTAMEWDVVKSVPVIKRLKTPPVEFDHLSNNEQELLLSNAKGIYYDMILIAMDTGLRISEMTVLKWEDINFQNRTLTVSRAKVKKVIGSTKSNKIRHVNLTDRLYDLLIVNKDKRGYIFTDEKGDSIIAKRTRRNLYRICEKAGLRKIGWHTLRHTFASRLASLGAPIISIKELLGHSSIEITMRYSHLSPSDLGNSINLLNQKP